MQAVCFSYLEASRFIKQCILKVALQAVAFSPTTASDIKRSNHESRI